MPQSRSTALPWLQKKERRGTNVNNKTNSHMKPQTRKQRRTATEEPPWNGQ